jgi:hypothetical protein
MPYKKTNDVQENRKRRENTSSGKTQGVQGDFVVED